MRVKFLRTVGKFDCQPVSKDFPTSPEFAAKPDGTMYREHEIADLGDAAANKFLKAGIAEPVTAKDAK
jgi:hypothetical protein